MNESKSPNLAPDPSNSLVPLTVPPSIEVWSGGVDSLCS